MTALANRLCGSSQGDDENGPAGRLPGRRENQEDYQRRKRAGSDGIKEEQMSEKLEWKEKYGVYSVSLANGFVTVVVEWVGVIKFM